MVTRYGKRGRPSAQLSSRHVEYVIEGALASSLACRQALLGRVDELFYHQAGRYNVYKSERGVPKFVIACCNTSALLQAVQEALDLLA
ncbi:MAG TPA: hypothetical protein VIH59_02640 [Candidatus Tectomicrobia bacterium]|jgi:hypothetical protein